MTSRTVSLDWILEASVICFWGCCGFDMLQQSILLFIYLGALYRSLIHVVIGSMEGGKMHS